ncbi:hypothetical protein AVEN_216565-1 [Araneus ventricosus]|uniref:Uncharacterized protein n=1 Tax=Araneus ventricosus TaxID=182803 RepID=A0A4Y2WB99_ARAVE|nr:hypothetical protein AVEN_46986-1 [Araneus ventricosus]GBO34725.1 hypothetical protein AVEN_216565-1 [Araneus ventricosus]
MTRTSNQLEPPFQTSVPHQQKPNSPAASAWAPDPPRHAQRAPGPHSRGPPSKPGFIKTDLRKTFGPPRYDWACLPGGFSVESGFEPGTLRTWGLTTRPPRPFTFNFNIFLKLVLSTIFNNAFLYTGSPLK